MTASFRLRTRMIITRRSPVRTEVSALCSEGSWDPKFPRRSRGKRLSSTGELFIEHAALGEFKSKSEPHTDFVIMSRSVESSTRWASDDINWRSGFYAGEPTRLCAFMNSFLGVINVDSDISWI